MTQSATVDREQLAALQVLRARFGDVEVLAVRPSAPLPAQPAVQESLLEEPAGPRWITPGHPGECPCCGSPHVRWTWKPDQQPTRESARCYGCGWVETRPYQRSTP